MSELLVTKDKRTGQGRWVLISSSAYLDRDKEIVTLGALEKAVARMKATGEYGDLRWWHTPVVLGKGDYADVIHYQLVESGTFASKAIEDSVRKQAGTLGASIGFKHPPTEPINGEYHDIKIGERSILPRGKESNLFTRLSVTGGEMQVTKAMLEEKKAGLVDLLGEDVASGLLSQMEATAKEADEQGVTRKEAKRKSWWQGVKEALGAIPDPDELEDTENTEDDTEAVEIESEKKEAKEANAGQSFTLEQVKELVSTEFARFREEIAEERTKATSNLVSKAEMGAVIAPIAEASLTTVQELAKVKEQVSGLTSDVPRGLASMFKASSNKATATDHANKLAEATKAKIQKSDDPMQTWLDEKGL